MFRCLHIILREFVQSVYIFGKQEPRYMPVPYVSHFYNGNSHFKQTELMIVKGTEQSLSSIFRGSATV